jgi:hypothetical protein
VTRAALVLVLLGAACKDGKPDCGKHAKCGRAEQDLNLSAIQKGARAHFLEQATFPIGTAGPTPATGCCASPNQKCAPDAAAWTGEVWQALLFEIDEPHHIHYAYDSRDGQTYTARAIADLDCDGVTMEYVLRGWVEHGAPKFELTQPLRVE